LCTKSWYEIAPADWSRYVPGTNEDSQRLRSSTRFLEKAISIASPSASSDLIWFLVFLVFWFLVFGLI
jgi:hypothetical protein